MAPSTPKRKTALAAINAAHAKSKAHSARINSKPLKSRLSPITSFNNEKEPPRPEIIDLCESDDEEDGRAGARRDSIQTDETDFFSAQSNQEAGPSTPKRRRSPSMDSRKAISIVSISETETSVSHEWSSVRSESAPPVRGPRYRVPDGKPLLDAPYVLMKLDKLPPLPYLKNLELRRVALTHVSCYTDSEGKELHLKDFRRLEWKGDSYFYDFVTNHLCSVFEHAGMTALTQARCILTTNITFAHIARHYGLQDQVRMSRSVLASNLNWTRPFLADLFEAYVGALSDESKADPTGDCKRRLDRWLSGVFSKEVFPQMAGFMERHPPTEKTRKMMLGATPSKKKVMRSLKAKWVRGVKEDKCSDMGLFRR